MTEFKKFGDAIRAAQGRTSQRGQGNVTRIELSLSQLLSEVGLNIPGLSSSASLAQAYAETDEAAPTSASPRPVAGGQRNDNTSGTAPELMQRRLNILFGSDRPTRVSDLGSTYVNPTYAEDLAEFVGDLTPFWVAEGDDVPESSFGFGPLQIDPHQLAVRTSWSRKLLLQTSTEHQRQMMAELLIKILDEVSAKAITGTGDNNEPSGILTRATQSVEIATPGQPTREELSAMVEILETNKRGGDLVFAVSAAVNKHLNDSQFFENGLLFGRYDVRTVQDLPPEGLILGRWADLAQAIFDTVSIVFRKGTSGEVQVVAVVDVDYRIRVESFVTVTEPEPEPDA